MDREQESGDRIVSVDLRTTGDRLDEVAKADKSESGSDQHNVDAQSQGEGSWVESVLLLQNQPVQAAQKRGRGRPRKSPVTSLPSGAGGRPSRTAPSYPAAKSKRYRTKLSTITRTESPLIALDHVRGLSNKEIADKYRVSQATISTLIDKFKPLFTELNEVDDYRNAKDKILDALQLKTLKSIACEEKQAAASLQQAAITFDILNRNSRLEKGLSTSNASFQGKTQVEFTLGGYKKGPVDN